METKALTELLVFDELESGGELTQRHLASRLGVSLGLINSILKKFVHKGYLKVSALPGNRVKYLLTFRGAAEKTRLTYSFIKYSVNLYRDAYNFLKMTFECLRAENQTSVVFYGVSEIAEVAWLVAKETGIHVVAVCDNERKGENFEGVIVSAPIMISEYQYDRVVITAYNLNTNDLGEFGVSSEKIITF